MPGNNRLKTYSLTGGEDLVTPDIDMPYGKARIAFNYEQNYNTGYSRISGYRSLVTTGAGTELDPIVNNTPGEGKILGIKVFNNQIFIFQNQVGGLTTGMWRVIPDEYRIGSEVDGDIPELWGSNIRVTMGSYIEIPASSMYQPKVDPLANDTDEPPIAIAGLEPDGYYEFTIHNFKASARGGTGAYLGLWDDIDDNTLINIGEQVMGSDSNLYVAIQEHKKKANRDPTTSSGYWTEVDDTISLPDASGNEHDITGNSGWLYGVDGKNPAFEFDGTVLRQIDSSYTPNIPHHIESNGNRLALGFRDGEVAMSALGAPFVFNAIYGAGSVGTTDWLTGMMAGPDGVMYIFCKDKTYLMKGMGGPLDQSNLVKHNKDVGAYPYTPAMLAGHALFFDTWGLTELAVTDRFGDVITSSISANVQEALIGAQPVIGKVYRDKAQYRLWFKTTSTDSSTNPHSISLIVTLIKGEEMGITHARYPIDVNHYDIGEYRTGAWSFGGNTEISITGTVDGKLYQMDVGNSFDGEEYTSYLTLPFTFLDSPHKVKKFKKMMINIDSNGFSNINYSADFGFGSAGTPKETGFETIEPSGGRWDWSSWDSFYWGVGYSNYLEGYINGHSENIAVTISNTSAVDFSHTLKDITYVYEYMRIEH